MASPTGEGYQKYSLEGENAQKWRVREDDIAKPTSNTKSTRAQFLSGSANTANILNVLRRQLSNASITNHASAQAGKQICDTVLPMKNSYYRTRSSFMRFIDRQLFGSARVAAESIQTQYYTSLRHHLCPNVMSEHLTNPILDHLLETLSKANPNAEDRTYLNDFFSTMTNEQPAAWMERLQTYPAIAGLQRLPPISSSPPSPSPPPSSSSPSPSSPPLSPSSPMLQQEGDAAQTSSSPPQPEDTTTHSSPLPSQPRSSDASARLSSPPRRNPRTERLKEAWQTMRSSSQDLLNRSTRQLTEGGRLAHKLFPQTQVPINPVEMEQINKLLTESIKDTTVASNGGMLLGLVSRYIDPETFENWLKTLNPQQFPNAQSYLQNEGVMEASRRTVSSVSLGKSNQEKLATWDRLLRETDREADREADNDRFNSGVRLLLNEITTISRTDPDSTVRQQATGLLDYIRERQSQMSSQSTPEQSTVSTSQIPPRVFHNPHPSTNMEPESLTSPTSIDLPHIPSDPEKNRAQIAKWKGLLEEADSERFRTGAPLITQGLNEILKTETDPDILAQAEALLRYIQEQTSPSQ